LILRLQCRALRAHESETIPWLARNLGSGITECRPDLRVSE
jgi:hypothetical protein